MFKKTILKLLVVCLVFGYTPQAKPMDILSGALAGAAFVIALAPLSAGIIALSGAGLGFGVYALCRSYTEKELLEHNSATIQKIQKWTDIIELTETEQVSELSKQLKVKKIKTQTHLNRLIKQIHGYYRGLQDNKTNFMKVLNKKEKNQETIGVYDIRVALNDIEMYLEKLSELESFLNTHKPEIVSFIKA